MKIKKSLKLTIILFLTILDFSCSNDENLTNPPKTIPTAPRNLLSQLDSNLITGQLRVRLNWTAPSNNGGSSITQYIIYRGSVPSSMIIYTFASADSLSSIDSAVDKDSTYYYGVSAKNELGEGPKSNVVNITPMQYIHLPSMPTSFSCLPGDNKVYLTWGAPVSNGGSDILNYKIYKGTTNNNLVLYQTLSASTFTYTDSTVNNLEQYYYQISASNILYEGLRTSIIQVTPSPVNIFFTMSGLIDPNNPNNYSFGFKPSENTKLTKLIAIFQAQPFFDTLINNNPNYIFSQDSTYFIGPYTGIQSGQAWNFQFTGTIVSNNHNYVVTSNFIVP